MHFVKTRPLILETLRGTRNQPGIGEARGPGEKASPGPLGDFIMSSTALGVAKTVNTPLIDLSTTNIFQGQVKMTFGLSAQFGYLCHLSPFLAWTAEIYMLSGGLFTDESALELMRVGEDSGPGPQMKFLFWFSH